MKTKEYYKEYGHNWYENNKNSPAYKKRALAYRQKYRDRYNMNNAEWKESHAQSHLWSNAKYRAKKVGLEFNIEISDIIIPEFCPYLGIKLTSHKLKGHLDSHMSLDRIDSSKGYIKGNVEVISYKANAMKQNATSQQLITFSINVLKKFNNGVLN